MIVKVCLYSTLRDKLPPENHGKAEVNLPPGSTLALLLEMLDIHQHVACAVNSQVEPNLDRELADGDEVRIFRPASGGVCFPKGKQASLRTPEKSRVAGLAIQSKVFVWVKF